MSSDYPSDWNTRRQEVYKRDDYTCQNCGSKGGPYGNVELHAHHIVPKGKGGTHQKSNLKTLCKQCHDAIHNNSMAPTADDSFGTTIDSDEPDTETIDIDEQFPLDVDSFPYFLHNHVVCLNTLYSTSAAYQECLQQLEALEDLIGPLINQSLEEASSDFVERYRATYTEAERAGDELTQAVTELSECNSAGFSSKTTSLHETVLDRMKTDVENVATYLGTIDNIATQKGLSRDDLTEIHLIKQELIEELEETRKPRDELFESLYRKTMQEMNKVNDRPDNTLHTFKKCPFCGERSRFETTGHLTRCHACRAEFAKRQTTHYGYELVHAPTEWKGWIGTSIGKYHWQTVGDIGPDVEKESVVSDYKEMKERIGFVRGVLIGIFTISIIIGFISGRLIPIGVISAIVVTVSGFAHQRYLIKNIDLNGEEST